MIQVMWVKLGLVNIFFIITIKIITFSHILAHIKHNKSSIHIVSIETRTNSIYVCVFVTR